MAHLVIPITSVYSYRNIILSGFAERLKDFLDVSIALPKNYPRGRELDAYRLLPFEVNLYNYPGKYLRLRERLGKAYTAKVEPKVFDYIYRRHRYFNREKSGLSYEKLSRTFKYYRSKWDARESRYRRLADREKALWKKYSDPGMGEVIRSWGADAMLSVLPHAPIERELSRWAQEAGLKMLSFILSFDNLTMKGGHSIVYDEYYVWNDIMKQELTSILPELDPERAKVSGTPQFQFYYMREYLKTRKELCDHFRLDDGRPIILFAGGSSRVLPHEVPIVEDLVQTLAKIDADERPQLIVRPHPIDLDSGRWNALIEKYSDLRLSIPWKSAEENPNIGTPSREDISILCSLIKHSAIIINSASTITLDAMIFDKPVICLDFTLPPFEGFRGHLHNFYDYAHYRAITKSGAISMATSSENLMELIKMYLSAPERHSEERRNLLKKMLGPDPARSIESACDHIATFFEGMNGGNTSRGRGNEPFKEVGEGFIPERIRA